MAMTAPSEIDAARARLEDGHANMLRMRVGSAQGVNRDDLRALLDDHARLAAEVERLTRERDAARASGAESERMLLAQVAITSEVTAERDRLAAALAELRGGVTRVVYLALHDSDEDTEWSDELEEAARRARAVLAATPADLATARDARVLREAAERADAQAVTSQITADRACECIRVEGDPSGDISACMNEADAQANELRRAAYWLRTEAERIERGGR